MDRPKNRKTEINYLYFSCLFLFLLVLTFSHFVHVNQPHWGIHLFFLLYALGQALLEILCLMLLGYSIHRWAPRWAFKFFIGVSFIFLMAHFANYTMVRLMDVSLSYLFKFLFGCGLDHFRVVFQATNMNSTMVAIILITSLLVPLAGIAFYWITHKLSVKKPLILSQKQILAAATLLALLLFGLDFAFQPYLTNDLHRKYGKTLPLGSTFFTPTPRCLSLPSTIRTMRSEENLQKQIAKQTFTCAKRPNIYLFVIETLRKDFLDPKIAPHMSDFGASNISPKLTFSNANSTFPSWFAIFHSCHPYQWTQVRDHWSNGSVPLQLLKKMGYRIRVYSSADLSYFNMDQVIFGKNRRLVDSIQDYSTNRLIEPCERDALAIEAVSSDAEKEREGTVYLVFLDSTHSEYSSPKEFQHFQPASGSLDYLAISRNASDLELLKNRYRNSIHWVDHLMGHFFSRLKKTNLYDEALIALTGDHGEEFFEEGALFHGTHLNDWQTSVPLFYKFPGPLPGSIPGLSTHLDIFPSILHFLTGESSWNQYFDGQSLFAPNRWPFVLSVQHNGTDVPYEFSLSDGQSKLIGRFLNPPLIHTIPSIELLALETPERREMAPTEEMVQRLFSGAFIPLVIEESNEI